MDMLVKVATILQLIALDTVLEWDSIGPFEFFTVYSPDGNVLSLLEAA